MFRIDNVLRVIFSVVILSVLSSVAVLKQSWILAVAAVLAHFILLKIFPVFRGYENLWMFIFVSASSIPLNIGLLVFMNRWGLLFGSWYVLGVLKCIMYYAAMFSVEEIIMGLFTRIVWRKQRAMML